MSAVQENSKKRKRTGRQREEARKKALELAETISDAPDVEAEEDEKTTEPSSTKQPVSPEKRIPAALKALHPLFKQARRQEVQRLIKKIKFLRSKADSREDVSDLEAQRGLLSHVPLDPIIASHLRLKLSKHPQYKQTSLPDPIVALLSPPNPESKASTSATPALVSKVENRLCSSKLVAASVKSAVGWIVGEEGARLVRRGEAKAAPKTKTKSQAKGAARVSQAPASDDEDASESDAESDGDVRVRPDQHDTDEEEQGIAADAAGWESGSVSGSDAGPSARSPVLDEGHSSEDDEAGNDDDGFANAIVKSLKVSKSKASLAAAPVEKSSKRKREPVTSSTFLPSLSAGFTRGDADSDPDMDYDSDGVIGGKKGVRKNRRGQRARQAIWEKKFGKNAKHVKKARDEEREEARKKAERKAKREEKLAFRAKLTGGQEDRGWAGRPGASHAASSRGAPPHVPIAQSAQAAGEKQALHPSWQAARLRRMKEAGTAPGSEAAKATKIVFD